MRSACERRTHLIKRGTRGAALKPVRFTADDRSGNDALRLAGFLPQISSNPDLIHRKQAM
jgi:hypothetical protein